MHVYFTRDSYVANPTGTMVHIKLRYGEQGEKSDVSVCNVEELGLRAIREKSYYDGSRDKRLNI